MGDGAGLQTALEPISCTHPTQLLGTALARGLLQNMASPNERKLRDGENAFPESLHPIVHTHPVTGRKALFVNENFTTRIEGLNKTESDAILKMLYDHIATPEFHCRFRWRENSVAFWDNRCTQHRTVWDYYPQVRHGYRVTIAGDKPF